MHWVNEKINKTNETMLPRWVRGREMTSTGKENKIIRLRNTASKTTYRRSQQKVLKNSLIFSLECNKTCMKKVQKP